MTVIIHLREQTKDCEQVISTEQISSAEFVCLANRFFFFSTIQRFPLLIDQTGHFEFLHSALVFRSIVASLLEPKLNFKMIELRSMIAFTTEPKLKHAILPKIV